MSVFKLGLTGSIGTGKTTTAALFAKHGCPVWSADDAVHRLYAVGGGGAALLAGLVPLALKDGIVDRGLLKATIAQDRSLLPKIEALVHPLVAQDRAAFLALYDSGIVVLDVPLLYETKLQSMMDAVLVVTAPPDVQRQRVLTRATMSAQDLELILSWQMPDQEKQKLADYIIETNTLERAEAAVIKLIESLRLHHA